MPGRSVVTIGNFDGVHVGHAALLRAARGHASGGGALRVVAMYFDPHPAAVLRPGSEPARLTTSDDRARILRDCGADEVVRLEPSTEFLSQTPEEFVAWLTREFAPGAVVEGPDFRFGRRRAGDVELLRRLGRESGFEVAVVAPVEVSLEDGTMVAASSSIVRWMLEYGRIGDAARVLGREYTVPGLVERGDRRGREIGYPTANVRTPCLAPADGVYAGRAALEDGREFAAAISVGTKPTFGEHGRALEAYLLDAGEGGAIAGLPEYGWPIRLSFSHWLRDQVRFESVGALLEQMGRDCQRVREFASGRQFA
jgi:riboflavin kinase / FMN adenylyltransferase